MLKSLEELAEVHYGKSPEGVLACEGEFPVVGTGGKYGTAKRPLFQGPGVVLPRKGSLSGAYYFSTPFWASDTTYVAVAKTGVHPKWLYYQLSNFNLSKLNEATGVPSINRNWLRRIKFETPSLTAQQKIAKILSTVDEAIEQTEALIEKTKKIKAGLMQDLFTRGVLPNGQLRPPRHQAPHLYKNSPLGWIPREWGIRTLEEVATVERGKFTIRPRNDPRYYGGEYPFIQTGEVANADGRVTMSYTQTLNEKGLKVSRLFPAGTIMVTIAANIADTCILGVPMCAPDSLVGVLPNPGESTRFLQLCISRRKEWLESRAPQTAQRNINLEDLRPLLIPYPGHAEQRDIAAKHDSLHNQIRIHEQEVNKLIEKKNGLMHDLLTGNRKTQ